MATRPTIDISSALIKYFTVGTAATYGFAGKFSAEGVVTNCSAGDAADVVFLETATTGNRVQCAMVNSDAICAMVVGTAGVTVGNWVKAASDGVVTTGTLGGGTTLVNVIGKAVQTGILNDQIGVQLIPFATVSA